MGRPMSLNGYAWVEGNVVNAVDPMGLQGGQPPQPKIIEETIETALQFIHEEIIPEGRLRDILIETLENNDIRVTTEVIDETMPTLMFRLNALGYAVQATTFGIPYESRGRIGNTYGHTLGTADHLSSWSSYPELDPTQLWESLNNTCVSTQPIPGVSPLPPFAPDDTGIGAGSQKRRDRDDDGECRGGIRKTVHIPDTLLPGQIVNSASALYTNLITPPFHAGQPTANKHDVECIASGMQQGIYPAYHFSFAQWDGQTRIDTQRLYGYDHSNLAGHWMLVDGHHRFLAWLFTGIVPPGISPTGNFNGIPLHPAVPWEYVQWERV